MGRGVATRAGRIFLRKVIVQIYPQRYQLASPVELYIDIEAIIASWCTKKPQSVTFSYRVRPRRLMRLQHAPNIVFAHGIAALRGQQPRSVSMAITHVVNAPTQIRNSPAAAGRHRFYIWTAGCQMNKDDSERIARSLVAAGHVPVSHPDRASFVILNGCSVRDNSDRKTFGRIGALGARRRREPDLQVALTGCTVRATEAELAPHARKLDLIFDTQEVDDLLTHMAARPGPVVDDWEDYLPQDLPGYGSPTRYVTIIYGCSKRCTFCIVPFRRGGERSRPVDEIEAELRAKADEGAVEITLLGQIVNRYGRDLDDDLDLCDLLRHLDRAEIVPRLRFLTAHPRHFDERLARAMADCPSVLEEINLPVQSGDDQVLRRMGRGYNTDWYRTMINMLRDHVPGVAISTDVIVGFPGETEEQFNGSLRLLEELEFDVVHIAAFSPRIGTVADRWGDDIPAAVKLERLHRCEAVQQTIAERINSRLPGSIQEVLFEQLQDGPAPGTGSRWMGRTRTNKLVFCLGDENIAVGDIRPTQITAATPWSLRGTTVGLA